MVDFPSPTAARVDRADVLVSYVDYFRDQVRLKLAALSPEDQRSTRLPSGWTPLELAHHLAHVERRWLDWGFLGLPVEDPWADEQDDRWHVPVGVDVLGLLADRADRLRRVVAEHPLDEVGAPGPRWDGAEPASLERVLLHLVNEYARHLGHLDVAVELAGGPVGE